MNKELISSIKSRLEISFGDSKIIDVNKSILLNGKLSTEVDANGLPVAISYSKISSPSQLNLSKGDKLFITKLTTGIRSPRVTYYYAKYVGEWYRVNNFDSCLFDFKLVDELYNSSINKLT